MPVPVIVGAVRGAAAVAKAGRKTRVIARSAERVVQSVDTSSKDESKQPPKLYGGFFWWFVLGLCVIGDILDILFLLIEAVAGATGFGLALSFVMWLADVVFDFFLNTIVIGYYVSAGGGGTVHRQIFKMLILASVSFLLEQIPVLEVLPILTLTFVLIRVVENKRRKAIAKTMAVAWQ